MTRFLVAALVAGSLTTLAAQPTLKYDTPKEWTSQAPSSGMRQAQFVLPRADSDAEDAAVIFFSARVRAAESTTTWIAGPAR